MYAMKTKPFQHQLTAFERSKDMAAFALFMEMGTGKTKVAIDTAGHLFTEQKIDALLVIGNKGSYRNWVDNEIPAHLPGDIPRYVTYWDSAASKPLQETYEDIMRPGGYFLRVLVMNVESLAFKRSFALAEKFCKAFATMLVVDESTTVKNPGAARSKVAAKLGALCRYRRIMTGEPITNSPLDLYAQCEVLGQGLLGFRSYYAFRAVYADMVQISAGQRAFKKIVGYKNLDNLTRSIQAWSYRVKKEDCLDLPPKVYLTHTVELTDEQRALYDRLREDALAELNGELVTAPLVITKLLRLHQVVCGHLTDDTGTVHDVKNNRLDALLDVVEETAGKVIIWATYRRDITAIHDALAKAYGLEAVVTPRTGKMPSSGSRTPKAPAGSSWATRRPGASASP
jgi:hypothetical protein